LELFGAADDTLEENIVRKTFQQKNFVMTQTNRRWMERRWSDRSCAGEEEDGSSGIILGTGDR
jgi:hypothetical protein